MKQNNLIVNHCENYRFCISEAQNISHNKAAIKELVEKGGQVDMNCFDSGWKRNPIVATIWNENVLVACGALKVPNKDYMKRLFEERAKSDYPGETIDRELGWIVTEAAYRGRGFCTNIVKMLLQYIGTEIEKPVYATTKQDNYPMQKILKNYRFNQTGQPFQSERGDYKLLLFVRDRITDHELEL